MGRLFMSKKEPRMPKKIESAIVNKSLCIVCEFSRIFFPASQANLKGQWVNRDVNKQTQNENE